VGWRIRFCGKRVFPQASTRRNSGEGREGGERRSIVPVRVPRCTSHTGGIFLARASDGGQTNSEFPLSGAKYAGVGSNCQSNC